MASAAVEGELDSDPSALAGVLSDWIAVAEAHTDPEAVWAADER